MEATTDIFQINEWKHPSTPTTLIEQSLHSCNIFLLHFRLSSGSGPLGLDWLEDDTKRMAGNDGRIIYAMKVLKEHKNYLGKYGRSYLWFTLIEKVEKEFLINRKPRDLYKNDDPNSHNFTWSSLAFAEADLASIEDFPGSEESH